MRLTLVISSLRAGGAERVMSIMANYWAAKGWIITLLTFEDGTKQPFYELDSRVTHQTLALAGYSSNPLVAIKSNLKRIYTLRKGIAESKPDIVISFLHTVNIIVLLATLGLSIPIVVAERSDPSRSRPNKRIWEKMRPWIYPRADRIIVQSKGAFDYFHPSLQSRMCIIPNPVLQPELKKDKSERFPENPSLIAMGRLSEEKGYELLLQSFAEVKDAYPQWNLTILGEGPLRLQLEFLRSRLGLTERIHFVGRVKNPSTFLESADIFVMSSRFEGFPNALCEAMACGLPVISTDCPSGPREIVRDGIDGILVPNEDISALATAMARLMSDEEERKHLGQKANEITERFGLKKVMGMWEVILTEVLKEKR